jgi:hypothetical protein
MRRLQSQQSSTTTILHQTARVHVNRESKTKTNIALITVDWSFLLPNVTVANSSVGARPNNVTVVLM